MFVYLYFLNLSGHYDGDYVDDDDDYDDYDDDEMMMTNLMVNIGYN